MVPESDVKRSSPDDFSSSDTPSLDLSIVIVSWNVWDLLRACLQSIEGASRPANEPLQDDKVREFGPVGSAARLEVVVVDNGSEDATVDLLPVKFPWVRLVNAGTNLGFTRGNNLGYAASRGPFVYFLNPDTEIITGSSAVSTEPTAAATKSEDGLWRLFSFIAVDDDAEQTIALVGPQLRYADGIWQNSRRTFPSALTGFLESTWIGRTWPRNPWARRLYMEDWPSDFTHDVDWVVGAAMFARRSALEQVRMPEYQGPFDEGFFMYSEEMDLCRRLKDVGWRIVYQPQSLVVHYEGRSSDQAVTARHISFNTSKVRYYQKHIGNKWAQALRYYLLLEFRWQLWLERVKGFLGHKRALRRQRIQVYKAVLDSGLRPDFSYQDSTTGADSASDSTQSKSIK